MSTAIALQDGITTQQLMEATGQKSAYNEVIPQLSVNYKSEDDQKQEIPRGAFVLRNKDGVPFFFKKASIQICFATYNYSHYDRKAKKQVATSVQESSMGGEFPDSAGGFKCGKVTGKAKEGLSPEQKETNNKIKAGRIVYGLLTATGKDAAGVEHTVENYPVRVFGRGANYMPPEEYLKSLGEKGVFMGAVETSLSLTRKVGDDDGEFWVINWENAGVAKVTGTDMFNTIKQFGEIVKAENVKIMEKHIAAVNGGAVDSTATDDGVAIDDCINDEIPFGEAAQS